MARFSELLKKKFQNPLKQQTPMRGILAALWEGVNVSAEDIDEAFSARGYLMNIAVVKGDKR